MSRRFPGNHPKLDAVRENKKKIHNEDKEEQLTQDETDALNQLENESQKRSINHSKTDPYNDVKVSLKRKRDSALNEIINELVNDQEEIDRNLFIACNVKKYLKQDKS